MPLRENLNLRLDEQMRADLEAIRDRSGPDVSLADVARRALREFIARELGGGQDHPGGTYVGR
jgi:hypothetical protein